MPIVVRRAAETDLIAADRLLQTAFARPTSFLAHLRLHMAVQGDLFWLAEEGGELIGSVGAVDYGGVAYIGLMAVDPARQRQGIARRLVAQLLSTLEQRGSKIALLDATDSGAPLYEAFGFVDDSQARVLELETFVAPSDNGAEVVVSSAASLEELAALDADGFGADRGKLLAALLELHRERLLVARDATGRLRGYLFARDGALGPWVASDRNTAAVLLAAALRLPFTNTPHVMVPRSNEAAFDLLTKHGFVERRHLRHMRRGGNGSPGKPALLFGQSSFAHG